jgi:hypothetical protein
MSSPTPLRYAIVAVVVAAGIALTAYLMTSETSERSVMLLLAYMASVDALRRSALFPAIDDRPRPLFFPGQNSLLLALACWIAAFTLRTYWPRFLPSAGNHPYVLTVTVVGLYVAFGVLLLRSGRSVLGIPSFWSGSRIKLR